MLLKQYNVVWALGTLTTAAFLFLAPAPAANVENLKEAKPHAAQNESPPEGVEFESVLDLKQERGGAKAQLRGADVAVSANWPVSLYANYRGSSGRWYGCTAALVGPRAMLTAAHCVPPSGEVRFRWNRKRYFTDCKRHPGYGVKGDQSPDFALCKLRIPGGIRLKTGQKFESLNTAHMDLHLGSRLRDTTQITLTGYGCTSDLAKYKKRRDGKYRVGRSYFLESSNSKKPSYGAEYYAPAERNNLITVDDEAYANLCPGDSGGPAFLERGNRRTIIGVNSRVMFRDGTKLTYGASLVSATGGPSFRSWAEGWARLKKVEVCGVHGTPRPCQ